MVAKFSSEGLKQYASAGAVADEVLSSIRTVVSFGGQQKEIDRYVTYNACTHAHGHTLHILYYTPCSYTHILYVLLYSVIVCRYNEHLKDARKIGIKKGISTGFGIALTSFCIYFIHAVGYW